MVKKYKFLFITIFAILILALVLTISKADVAYTRSFPSNDGTIVLNVTGLELSDEKQCDFSLVQKGGTPIDWFDITDYNETSVNIEFKASNPKLIEVLKKTNNGQIFVREKNAEELIVNRLNVDLTLPYLIANGVTKDEKNYAMYGFIYGSYGTTYSHLDIFASYQWQKLNIQNETLIRKFLELKNNNNNDYSSLESYLPQKPSNGYVSGNYARYTDKNDGLYLLWVKRTAADCKDIHFL